MADWVNIIENQTGTSTPTYDDAKYNESPAARIFMVGFGCAFIALIGILGYHFLKDKDAIS